MLVTVVSTTLASYVLGRKAVGLSPRRLAAAASSVAHQIGLGVIFLAVNLGIAFTVVLAVRRLTGVFVSSYLLDDVAWAILSLFQGLLFHAWSSQGPGKGDGTAGAGQRAARSEPTPR